MDAVLRGVNGQEFHGPGVGLLCPAVEQTECIRYGIRPELQPVIGIYSPPGRYQPVQAEPAGPDRFCEIDQRTKFAAVLCCQGDPDPAAYACIPAMGERGDGTPERPRGIPDRSRVAGVAPSREIPAYSIPLSLMFRAISAVMSVPFVLSAILMPFSRAWRASSQISSRISGSPPERGSAAPLPRLNHR